MIVYVLWACGVLCICLCNKDIHVIITMYILIYNNVV